MKSTGATESAMSVKRQLSQNMAISNQTVVPMLSYRDGLAALTWLAEAFGFVERTRHVGHDGRLAHGEMMAGDNIIMLATPAAEYEGPTLHRFHCKRADEWLSVPWMPAPLGCPF